MHDQVKEFIEHYVYLIEKGQIDMFIYLAAKEFKEYNRQKMEQLLRILDEIDIDYKPACERLFIEDFKEAATEYAKAPKGGRQIFLNIFISRYMNNRRYGLSIDECAHIINLQTSFSCAPYQHNKNEWALTV